MALPDREWVVDISCVTKWTKLDMRWRGVSVDTLLEHVELARQAAFVIAYVRRRLHDEPADRATSLNGQAFVAWEYDGKPLAPEHGGPARLVVPAATSGRARSGCAASGSRTDDEPGFWESLGYHNRGDQWLEERYSGD